MRPRRLLRGGWPGRRAGLDSALTWLGGLPLSTLLALGAALVLLLASVGLVIFTLSEQRTAERVAVVATPSPSRTTARTPAATVTRTTTAPGTATRGTPGRATITPGRGTAITALGPLGSGRSRAARGIGGTLASIPNLPSSSAPPAAGQPTPTASRPAAANQPTPTPRPAGPPTPTRPIAAAPTPTPTRPAVIPIATPTPTRPAVVPVPTPTPTRPAVAAIPTPTPTRPAAAAPVPTATPTRAVSAPAPAPTPTRPAAAALPPTPTQAVVAPAPTPTQAPVAPPPPVAPTPTPTPKFPAVALPGADARPYRYTLTYTRGDDLGTVPQAENAYTLTWRSYSADEVAALADALGLRGPVEETADGFRVTDPGTLTVSNAANGLIHYTAPSGAPTSAAAGEAAAATATATRNGTASRSTPAPTRAPAAALSDDAALAAAKGWLAEKGLPLPADANAGRVTRPVAGQIAVTFNPQQPSGPILGGPAIVVSLDAASGTVREVRYRWPSGVEESTLIRLRPVTAAWADVQAGQGYAEVDAPVPATTTPGAVFKGTARATKVRVGWALATADDGANYLLPVYVFEGDATLEGQTRPVPFRVYIPAAQ